MKNIRLIIENFHFLGRIAYSGDLDQNSLVLEKADDFFMSFIKEVKDSFSVGELEFSHNSVVNPLYLAAASRYLRRMIKNFKIFRIHEKLER